MVGKTISFCCDNNTYTPMMNRLLKEYPTSLDDLEYETQTKIFNKVSSFLANWLTMTIICYFEESTSRSLYISDFIRLFEIDLKKILKLFVMKLLYNRMRKSFFESVKLLNKKEDLDYYNIHAEEYIVLTKDNDIKHFSAENLFLARTTLNPDKAQLLVSSKLRDNDITKKISSQHKRSLSKDNIIDL